MTLFSFWYTFIMCILYFYTMYSVCTVKDCPHVKNDFSFFYFLLFYFFVWQHLHAQYDELFPTLCNDFPDIFPPELYTWEKFLWACELWYSNSMKIMFSDGKLRTCLIPIAGFLNHSVCKYSLFRIFCPFSFLFRIFRWKSLYILCIGHWIQWGN